MYSSTVGILHGIKLTSKIRFAHALRQGAEIRTVHFCLHALQWAKKHNKASDGSLACHTGNCLTDNA